MEPEHAVVYDALEAEDRLTFRPPDAPVYQALLAEDGNIFVRFFDKSVVVDENFTSETRQQTIEKFEKYSKGNDFDDFILRIYRAMQTMPEIGEDAEDVSMQTELERESDRTILSRIESLSRPREEFNVADFIIRKQMSRDYVWLVLDSDEEVREELNTIDDFFDLVASEELRTMLQVIMMLNKKHRYSVLYIP